MVEGSVNKQVRRFCGWADAHLLTVGVLLLAVAVLQTGGGGAQFGLECELMTQQLRRQTVILLLEYFSRWQFRHG